MWCRQPQERCCLAQVYGVPLCITNTWLVMITLLQHTHPALPHYADKDWEWLRGALSTVDRSYGPLDYVFHHIADTHVAHHLFSTMPHYHAKVREACSQQHFSGSYGASHLPLHVTLSCQETESVLLGQISNHLTMLLAQSSLSQTYAKELLSL